MRHKLTQNTGPVVSLTGVELRTGQTVTFVSRDDGIQHTVRVLGRAGNATGKHNNWYNLQHLEPDGSEGQEVLKSLICKSYRKIIQPVPQNLLGYCYQ